MSTPAPDETPLIIVGRLRRAHGIRGELLVEPMTETPDAIFAPGARVFAGTATGDPGPSPRTLTVEDAREFRDLLLVTFEEIVDRTEAEKWRDRYLLVPEADVEAPADDEIFVHQLAGLELFAGDGTHIGTVLGSYDVAGRLLLEVRRAQGTVLLPYEAPFISAVDVPGRRLVMTLPDGMLD
ncbi:MAG: 16S rRNA processing protein RimM [Gemmatimonadaceae bacterium]|nr:16S rRNA processing protein RimM [Gemmatimonadaceae bacterium]